MIFHTNFSKFLKKSEMIESNFPSFQTKIITPKALVKSFVGPTRIGLIIPPLNIRISFDSFLSILKICLFLASPCDKPGKGGCDQICKPDGDEVICECEPGYTRNEETESCEKSKISTFVHMKAIFIYQDCFQL